MKCERCSVESLRIVQERIQTEHGPDRAVGLVTLDQVVPFSTALGRLEEQAVQRLQVRSDCPDFTSD